MYKRIFASLNCWRFLEINQTWCSTSILWWLYRDIDNLITLVNTSLTQPNPYPSTNQKRNQIGYHKSINNLLWKYWFLYNLSIYFAQLWGFRAFATPACIWWQFPFFWNIWSWSPIPDNIRCCYPIRWSIWQWRCWTGAIGSTVGISMNSYWISLDSVYIYAS